MSATEFSEAEIKDWETYKADYKKVYPDQEEDKKRMKQYLATKEKIKKHNELFEKGEVTFTMGINQFADQFSEEACCFKGTLTKSE